jgi:hypothetical protein
MNEILVFGAEVAASLLVSLFIVLRLQGLLRRIGSEACERGAGSTEFWVTYTQLMMFMAPLILIAFISRAGSIPELSAVAQVKSSLLIVMSGQFVGLVLVGRAVWKSLIAPTPKPWHVTSAAPAAGAAPAAAGAAS